jgi:hypothetical protein
VQSYSGPDWSTSLFDTQKTQMAFHTMRNRGLVKRLNNKTAQQASERNVLIVLLVMGVYVNTNKITFASVCSRSTDLIGMANQFGPISSFHNNRKSVFLDFLFFNLFLHTFT